MDLEPDIAQARDPHARDVPAHEAPARETEIAATLENHLLSNATDRSVSHAFNMLTHTVLNHNARTLEDLVRDMLRPMLKSWLDENLPVIVERLVRTEIERVARGGR
jgi:cell pole-organizing protein PopZ